MIDPDARSLFGHGLWILGVSGLVAALSYYSWLAKRQRRGLGELMGAERWAATAVAAGLLLAAIGWLVLPGAAWWQRAVWVVVALGAASHLPPPRAKR